MAYIVFDTETTSLDKPFCYDLGYLICDEEAGPIQQRHFIIEQTWHNLPLFESAYYANKRPQYVQLMRQHKAIMDKWGYVMRQMKKDIRDYGVTTAYAYNAAFDDKVFTFNCDWFKCNNPLEDIPVYDIWGYASQFITNEQEYKDFCEVNQLFTENGNYSSNAENVFKYISFDTEFTEEHIGLYDCQIEQQILEYCFEKGAIPCHDYKVIKILERPQHTPYKIKVNGKVIHEGKYLKQYMRQKIWYFTEEAD